jgi:Ca2+-transporting ATPase
MALVGLFITVMSLVIYHYSFTHYDQLTARSIAFSFLVYVILFRSLASRSDTLCFFELDFNVSHLMAVLIPLVFQLGMQQSEFFLSVFKIKSLSLQQNAVLIVLAIIPLILLELKKLLKRSFIA